MKDVKLPPNSPTQLVLNKHADFIAAYGKKKDDYVCEMMDMLNFFKEDCILTDLLTDRLIDSLNGYLVTLFDGYLATSFSHIVPKRRHIVPLRSHIVPLKVSFAAPY